MSTTFSNTLKVHPAEDTSSIEITEADDQNANTINLWDMNGNLIGFLAQGGQVIMPSYVGRQPSGVNGNAFEVQSPSPTTWVVSSWKYNGCFLPGKVSGSEAYNGSLYIDSTTEKLMFKDSLGVSHELY